MLLSQFQIHNGLMKGCSIMKMMFKKCKRVYYVEYAIQGLHSQQWHWDICKNVWERMNKNDVIF